MNVAGKYTFFGSPRNLMSFYLKNKYILGIPRPKIKPESVKAKANIMLINITWKNPSTDNIKIKDCWDRNYTAHFGNTQQHCLAN